MSQKLFEKNVAVLKEKIENHAYIIPISRHRNPDGTINIDQFKENWEKQMEDFEKIQLWEQAPDFDDRDPLQIAPYMVLIPSDNPKAKERSTILIAHGGGFEIRTGGEGPNIAWYFHERGFNTAILTYRLKPYTRFHCIDDMQRAIRMLRACKTDWNLSEKVTVMGFSAGGMLCGNCATKYDLGNPDSEDPIEQQSCRPDGAVLGYAAFSALSFPSMFGASNDGLDMYGQGMKELAYLAFEKNISWDTPPFFIWQTLSDDGRLGMNLAKELADMRVPYELHIFEGGAHGLGMADGENDLGMDIPHIHHWGRLCDEWMEMHNL